MLESNTNMLFEKLNARKEDKRPLNHLLWKKQAHSLIHIMPRCVLHLHGHRNKMVPFLKLFLYLWILTMALSFANAHVGQLITLEAIISQIGLVTITLAMKT
jgi:hypothetical protein